MSCARCGGDHPFAFGYGCNEPRDQAVMTTAARDIIAAFMEGYSEREYATADALVDRLRDAGYELVHLAPNDHAMLFPLGDVGIYADDDDVIGITYARTCPSGWSLVCTDESTMTTTYVDEYAVAAYLAWCLGAPDVYRWYLSDRAVAQRWDDMKDGRA